MNENIPGITPLIKHADNGPSAAEQADLKRHLAEKLQQLSALADTTSLQRARLQMDIAELLNALGRKQEAWDIAREAFWISMQMESWQDAVEACDVLFQAGQEDSMAALGMGIWLAVTFPVDPQVTVAMLIHLVEETPDAAEAGPLAAIAARYVVDLRADDDRHESQCFLVDNLISMVAKRHSNVQDQAAMDKWLDRLALRDPQVFLPRLSREVDAIVGGKWWFDRDQLRSRLPD
ncbi:hypothetical protein [Sideroxydans lithotrophicus]|uniref:Uncharacterized protein n=1 Tax=Sideroxydans lithotrophicus (strain ES-1) TaxID=580332 RepID=D5CTN4_SIDLE|nr:hypothetical protein [Sideroxydans lithotrophicus]ADE10340.1 conserved hypothetical protein [Sideroxydans lithotrophicus ES-1]